MAVNIAINTEEIHSVTNSLKGIILSPMNIPTWYFMSLFIFALLTPLIKFMQKGSIRMIILLAVSSLINILLWIAFPAKISPIPYLGLYLTRLGLYFPAFITGSVAGKLSNELNVKWLTVKSDISKDLFGIVAVISIFTTFIMLNIPLALRTLLWYICPFCLWFLLPEKLFKGRKIIKYITEPSFMIFVTHFMLLTIMSTLIKRDSTVVYILQIVMTVAIASAIYYLLKLLCPRVLVFLMGNRNNNARG